MIDAMLLPEVRAEFAKRAEWRREEDKRAAELHRKKEKDREKREDEREADAEEATAIALATDAEIIEFTADLDAYDAATIEALQQNRIELDVVDDELEQMLAQAFVLPDGRRVFKTEDGLRVFDENGQELSAEDFDPNEIDDAKPSWERFSHFQDERAKLAAEQQSLIEFQQRLDTARERLDAGDVTADELQTMDKEVKLAMPDAVSEFLPEEKREAASVDPEPALDAKPYRPGVQLAMPEL